MSTEHQPRTAEKDAPPASVSDQNGEETHPDVGRGAGTESEADHRERTRQRSRPGDLDDGQS